jgi:hypothetical protein
MIRDFYAKRVACYVYQVKLDLPETKPSGEGPSPTNVTSITTRARPARLSPLRAFASKIDLAWRVRLCGRAGRLMA